MTEYLKIDDLLVDDLPGEDFEIPGKGVIRIRSLSRAETLDVGTLKNAAEIERRMLVYGVVEPKLTEELALQWQQAWGTHLVELVAGQIYRLSAYGKEAAKAAYKRAAPEPEPTV